MKEFYPEGELFETAENKRYLSSIAWLQTAYSKEVILEGLVTICDSEHNLIVDLGCIKGVIPREEGAMGISEGTTRDIALISRVGKPVCFIITGFKTENSGKMYACLSRKAAQMRCKRNFLNHLCPGKIINARVTHLENFGAFCDIGCGFVSLLPIDSISVSRISHPKDRFSVGDSLRVAVKSIEGDKINLTLKELLGTWEQNASLFEAGQTVTGIVRSIESYGIFVELTPNLAGLAEPRPDVYIGEQACVYIKSINPEKMKIKLVLIDSFDGEDKTKLNYFYNNDRICEFNYSPQNSVKKITTVF